MHLTVNDSEASDLITALKLAHDHCLLTAKRHEKKGDRAALSRIFTQKAQVFADLLVKVESIT